MRNHLLTIVTGIYFILVTIYNIFGTSKTVLWTLFEKSSTEILILILICFTYSTLKNTISMLSAFALGVFFATKTISRVVIAIASDFNYVAYRELMTDQYISIIFSLLILAIFMLVKYLKK